MIPTCTESSFGEFNLFYSGIRLGRIFSIAYSSLFSVSASLRSNDSYVSAISHVRHLLEDWRLSVPIQFRPNEPIQLTSNTNATVKLATIHTQYSYYSVVIALERLTLHVGHQDARRLEESKQSLMRAARTVIELTRHLAVEPHVPIL
jgi:hypothetical protein